MSPKGVLLEDSFSFHSRLQQFSVSRYLFTFMFMSGAVGGSSVIDSMSVIGRDRSVIVFKNRMAFSKYVRVLGGWRATGYSLCPVGEGELIGGRI